MPRRSASPALRSLSCRRTSVTFVDDFRHLDPEQLARAASLPPGALDGVVLTGEPLVEVPYVAMRLRLAGCPPLPERPIPPELLDE
jgi:hypothetical protein